MRAVVFGVVVLSGVGCLRSGREPVSAPTPREATHPRCETPKLPQFALGQLDLATPVPPAAGFESAVARDKPLPLDESRPAFASYLHQVHVRLHPLFAESFLESLCSVPPDHPLRNAELVTEVGVMVNGATGELESLAVVRSSGVAEFDAGAVRSFAGAFPVSAPRVTWSSDGRVYFKWELHRRREEACSTYFARPLRFELPARAHSESPPHWALRPSGQKESRASVAGIMPISPRG